MLIRSLLVATLVTLGVADQHETAPGAGDSWGYPEDDDSWGSVCTTGQEQSPVDLVTCDNGEEQPMPAIAPASGTDGWGDATTLENTGHGLTLKMPEPNTYKTTMRGELYTMVQCHFHWGSEHTQSGMQHPLEGHCVHTKDVTMGGRTHGVLGIFWQVGADEDRFLGQFLGSAPGVDEADVSVTVAMDLLLQGLTLYNYWQYDGGLTTPPCSEVVDWHVVMTPRILSQAQLDVVKDKIGSWGPASTHGNFRLPQGLNGRIVLGCSQLQGLAPDHGGGGSADGGDHAGVVHVDWAYPEDGRWDGQCITGSRQSPVNLQSCDDNSDGVELMDTISQVGWGTARQVRNTGHGLQVVMPYPLTFKTRMRDGNLYTMAQCHLHWGSEHFVGGRQKSLEGHCVHTKDNVGQGHNTHGVLGILWEEGRVDEWLEQWIGEAPDFGEDDVEIGSGIDMRILLTGNLALNEYWQYNGGLTTPPCTEVVDWHVLMTPRRLTALQLGQIREKTGSWGHESNIGNFRLPKPLGERNVLGCATPQLGADEVTDSGASRPLGRAASAVLLLLAFVGVLSR